MKHMAASSAMRWPMKRATGSQAFAMRAISCREHRHRRNRSEHGSSGGQYGSGAG